ncbi:hypothetical protein B0H14DRAFT_2214516, partial [Mycena olivaceomarginata]
DVENDLARTANLFLPRIMARLLRVQGRRLHNWQSALRREHARRDPTLNSIGPEPRKQLFHSHFAVTVE